MERVSLNCKITVEVVEIQWGGNRCEFVGADLTDADLRGADLSLTNAAKARFILLEM